MEASGVLRIEGHGNSIPVPVNVPVEHLSCGNSSTPLSASSWTQGAIFQPPVRRTHDNRTQPPHLPSRHSTNPFQGAPAPIPLAGWDLRAPDIFRERPLATQLDRNAEWLHARPRSTTQKPPNVQVSRAFHYAHEGWVHFYPCRS